MSEAAIAAIDLCVVSLSGQYPHPSFQSVLSDGYESVLSIADTIDAIEALDSTFKKKVFVHGLSPCPWFAHYELTSLHQASPMIARLESAIRSSSSRQEIEVLSSQLEVLNRFRVALFEQRLFRMQKGKGRLDGDARFQTQKIAAEAKASSLKADLNSTRSVARDIFKSKMSEFIFKKADELFEKGIFVTGQQNNVGVAGFHRHAALKATKENALNIAGFVQMIAMDFKEAGGNWDEINAIACNRNVPNSVLSHGQGEYHIHKSNEGASYVIASGDYPIDCGRLVIAASANGPVLEKIDARGSYVKLWPTWEYHGVEKVAKDKRTSIILYKHRGQVQRDVELLEDIGFSINASTSTTTFPKNTTDHKRKLNVGAKVIAQWGEQEYSGTIKRKKGAQFDILFDEDGTLGWVQRRNVRSIGNVQVNEAVSETQARIVAIAEKEAFETVDEHEDTEDAFNLVYSKTPTDEEIAFANSVYAKITDLNGSDGTPLDWSTITTKSDAHSAAGLLVLSKGTKRIGVASAVIFESGLILVENMACKFSIRTKFYSQILNDFIGTSLCVICAQDAHAACAREAGFKNAPAQKKLMNMFSKATGLGYNKKCNVDKRAYEVGSIYILK